MVEVVVAKRAAAEAARAAPEAARTDDRAGLRRFLVAGAIVELVWLAALGYLISLFA